MVTPPNDTEARDLNRRLQAYLRGAAMLRRGHERVGPFLASFNERSDNPSFSYAIPDDGVEPTGEEIAALIAAFGARGRKPRLEYIAAAAPRLEAALIARGFVAEGRFPVMVCLPGMEAQSTGAAGFEVFPVSADVDLAKADRAQAEAFDAQSLGPDDLRRMIVRGGIVAAARDLASDEIAGAGVAMPPVDGISELAGIGVRPDFRRRGMAGALTALLAHEAFAAGATLAWLTPGSRDAERIYARAGFTVASEALHISLT